MLDILKCSLIPLGSRTFNKVFDFGSHRGHSLTDTYSRLGLFEGTGVNFAMMVGVPVIAALTKAGTEPGRYTRELGKIIYASVMRAAMKPSNWRFDGSIEEIRNSRSWLEDASGPVRVRRIEELLGIQERPRSRFLSIGNDFEAANFDDIAERYAQPRRPQVVLLDAFDLADAVEACGPGPLFLLEPKGTK